MLTALNSIWAQIDPEIHIKEMENPFRIESFPSEVRPEFPGTKREMLDFIELRFQFDPEMLIGQSYYLEATLQVDISATGEVLNVHDLNNHQHIFMDPLDAKADKRKMKLFNELKRIFLKMPKWIPGKTKGRNVKSSTVVHYKKPLYFPYGNELITDHLVYLENGQLDTTHIYTNPQVKPQQKFGSTEYTYAMSLQFNYPEALLKDSVIFAYTYECIIDEKGNPMSSTLSSSPSPYPLLDSISAVHMKNLPQYEPACIDGVPVKCTLRAGHFVYPPDFLKNGKHGMRKMRQAGRYYETSKQGLRRHFEECFNYPEALKEEPIFGTVYLSLEAKEDGTLKFCYVLHGINPLIDAEVERVLKESSDWRYVNYDQPYTKGQAIIVGVRIMEKHL